jgi:dienelactone hydrolase
MIKEAIMRKCWFSFVAALFCSMTAQAQPETKFVVYNQGDTTLKGYLASPGGYMKMISSKRPGVLVVPEWWGLNDYAKKRAEQLAELGYFALAVDMYGNGASSTDPKEAGAMAAKVKGNRQLMRERIKAGLYMLKDDPHVDPERIAAIGYCFGGTTVLELARSGADIAGVVSFHGGLDTPMPATPKSIKCKILVCHGADDSFEPPEQIAAFEKEMKDADADWQFNVYSKAVHGFTNPNNKNSSMKGVAYNEEADKRSWQAMKQFFAEIFK